VTQLKVKGMASADDEDAHALAPFLGERLTALGLDYETYGAYILPLLTDEDEDDEEWGSVMELLQASSESHSDNDQVWVDLKSDIANAWRVHREQIVQQEREYHEQREHELQAQLQRERDIAAAAAAAAVDHPVTQHAPIDDAKRALVLRFAYENDDDDDKTNNNKSDGVHHHRGGGGDGGGGEGTLITNREYAKQMELERTREMRSHKQTATKREEQQKTKEARQNNLELKEERRKRATKGERKR
jgi:hypothetical protein